ncbi:MAG: hypothetical protein AAGD43_02360, partial [Pseudomonadota bacterium]
MNDAQQKIRVVLGPVARTLVEGTEVNRAEALDEAIEELIKKAQSSSDPNREIGSLNEELARLQTVIANQSAVIKTLQDVVILEQRMTRIFVASILSDDSEEQHQIMEMAAGAVEGLIDQSGLISEQERETLKSREH